jgi:hypothetical protein
MKRLLKLSPPNAYIDPNMIGPDGLVPALRSFITGIRRPGGFRVGQAIDAFDEDGNTYTGIVARVDRQLLYIDITVRTPRAWELAPSRYLNVVRGHPFIPPNPAPISLGKPLATKPQTVIA